MENRIFHIDMDSFFPSVETIDFPQYKNIPMVVGHKVVASANYKAREYNIKAGMNIKDARNAYKKLIILKPNFDKYSKVSWQIFDFLSSLSKTIEIGSIDEWYLEMNSNQFDSWSEKEFATYIKTYIKNHFKLDCTVGNSFTKFLAKTATNLAKPNGFLTLNKTNFYDLIKDLEVKKIVGVGPNTTHILNGENIYYVKDIINYQEDYLIHKKLGVVWSKLKSEVKGIPYEFINNAHQQKMIGRSQSIYNFNDYTEFKNLILDLCSDINKNLKVINKSFTNINLKIKLLNGNLINKSYRNTTYVNQIDPQIVIGLFEQCVIPNLFNQVKNLSINISNLSQINTTNIQLSIFDEFNKTNSKGSKLEKIKNMVNKRLNKKVIDFASKKY
ncbi:MAG: DNA polymerase IV [Malacoplasma sp.]|nr:DNA polymerase IV [Malacoplasma sp.]